MLAKIVFIVGVVLFIVNIFPVLGLGIDLNENYHKATITFILVSFGIKYLFDTNEK